MSLCSVYMFISVLHISAAFRAQLPHTIVSSCSFLIQILGWAFAEGGFQSSETLPSFLCSQMKPEAKTAVSWCIAWQASAALSPWLLLTSCRSSTCPWTMLMTLSRWRNPTSPRTSTSWANCLTLKGPWDSAAPVTTGSRPSSYTLLLLPTRMSTRWTPCNLRERHPTCLAGSVPFLQQFSLGQHWAGCFLCVWPQVSKRHQLSVLDKVAKCKIGYYRGRDLLHSFFWKDKTCCLDPGNMFAPLPPAYPSRDWTSIQMRRVGPRSRGRGMCSLGPCRTVSCCIWN